MSRRSVQTLPAPFCWPPLSTFAAMSFTLGEYFITTVFVHCIYLRSAREPLRRVDNVLSLIGIYNLYCTRKEIAWQLIILKACVHTKFISSPGEYLFTKSLSGFYFQMVAILPSTKGIIILDDYMYI